MAASHRDNVLFLFLCCLLLPGGRRSADACSIEVAGLPAPPTDEDSLYAFLSKLSEYAEECLPDNVR
jgi:hypothetical protein